MLAAVVAIASAFLLVNLGDHYLWQDEAETALVGKTILSRGVPVGTDGRNAFSQEMAGDQKKNDPWRLHPWLQFYLVAGSFALLGADTFTARLPFALLGIGVVIATYLLTRELFGNRWTALNAAALLTASVPFLLLSRQCRYFSAIALFVMLGLWVYWRYLKSPGKSGLGLIASSTLIFHTFYPYFFLFSGSLIAHAALFRPDRLKSLLRALAVSALINLPWFLWFRATPGIRQSLLQPASIAERFLFFLGEIDEFVFPAWLPAVAVILAATYYFRKRMAGVKRKEALTTLLPHASETSLLVTMALVAVLFFSVPSYTYFRYLIPVIPILTILAALIITSAFRIHSAFGLSLLVIMIWIQPLDRFVYELTNSYRGPIRGIVEYLQKHGSDRDTVLVTYEDLPLKFYTGLRIMGGLTGESLDGAAEADWIIMRKYMISSYEIPVRNFIRERIALENYTPVLIDAPDLPFENRESPREHHFETVKDETRVVIFKKNGKASQ